MASQAKEKASLEIREVAAEIVLDSVVCGWHIEQVQLMYKIIDKETRQFFCVDDLATACEQLVKLVKENASEETIDQWIATGN